MQRPTLILLTAAAALGVGVMNRMQNPAPRIDSASPSAPAIAGHSRTGAHPPAAASSPAAHPVAPALPPVASSFSSPLITRTSRPVPPSSRASVERSDRLERETAASPDREPRQSASRQVAMVIAPRPANPLPAAARPSHPAPAPLAGSSAGPAALAVELDRGVQLPTALLDEPEPKTPAQTAVKQQIAGEFASQLREATADPEAFEDRWSSARAWANWEYQKFFGGAAANRAGINAGLEALAEP